MTTLEIIALGFNSFLVQNILLSRFLGICSFLGVSNKEKSAVGMGLSVFFVITLSSIISYFIYYSILVPNDITYMRTIIFILVISSIVQFAEMVIKKFMPSLYKLLGIYLPLITTNCAVLAVALINVEEGFSFIEVLVFSMSTSLGYSTIIFIFSTIRVKIETSPIPEVFKGIPVALVTASIMALSFLGLTGLI